VRPPPQSSPCATGRCSACHHHPLQPGLTARWRALRVGSLMFADCAERSDPNASHLLADLTQFGRSHAFRSTGSDHAWLSALPLLSLHHSFPGSAVWHRPCPHHPVFAISFCLWQLEHLRPAISVALLRSPRALQQLDLLPATWPSPSFLLSGSGSPRDFAGQVDLPPLAICSLALARTYP